MKKVLLFFAFCMVVWPISIIANPLPFLSKDSGRTDTDAVKEITSPTTDLKVRERFIEHSLLILNVSKNELHEIIQSKSYFTTKCEDCELESSGLVGPDLVVTPFRDVGPEENVTWAIVRNKPIPWFLPQCANIVFQKKKNIRPAKVKVAEFVAIQSIPCRQVAPTIVTHPFAGVGSSNFYLGDSSWGWWHTSGSWSGTVFYYPTECVCEEYIIKK